MNSPDEIEFRHLTNTKNKFWEKKVTFFRILLTIKKNPTFKIKYFRLFV